MIRTNVLWAQEYGLCQDAAFAEYVGGLAGTPFSGPIIFCAFGWLIGPLALGWFDVEVEAEGLRLLAEMTLALVLFADAAKVDLGVLRRSIDIPQRLLLLALPLIILLGIGTGIVIFSVVLHGLSANPLVAALTRTRAAE